MMKTRNLVIVLCLLGFGIFLLGSVQPSLAGDDSTSEEGNIYLPLILKPSPKSAIVHRPRQAPP